MPPHLDRREAGGLLSTTGKGFGQRLESLILLQEAHTIGIENRRACCQFFFLLPLHSSAYVSSSFQSLWSVFVFSLFAS